VDDLVDDLIREIREKVEKEKIVIVKIVKRTSESYYNYKVSDILIFYKPKRVQYEESDVRDIEIVEVWIGVFQQYPLATPDILEQEFKDNYVVERVRI
jgi:excinuclease UvrABC helicase subunit UvrB